LAVPGLATLQPTLRCLMLSDRRLAPAALVDSLLMKAHQPSRQSGASSPQSGAG